MNKLYLLDAYALIYRAYYALIRTPRINSKGFNTSAIYGFVNTLEEIKRLSPTHMAVAFDPKGGKTFRNELYPLYKAQREAMPEDIRKSVPVIKDIIKAMNIPILEAENFEADDVIGTASKKFASPENEVYMITGDKDYGQLVNENVWMLKPSHGGGFEKMGVEGRATICNMAIEMGAKNGIMEPNKEVIQYVSQRTGKKESELNIVKSDEDAQYSEEMHFDITDMEPQIACPNDVDNVKDISKVEGTAVDQCLIGSCTNGRLSDLKDAYEILKDNEINNDTRLLILPASAEIYKQAIHEGYIDAFIDAGAIICNPGCGPCLGGHMGVLSEGETCISTTNRNFKGRMGDPKSSVYLANSKVVAASAIEGVITNPKDL